MTVPLVAATLFSGNLDKARLFLQEYGYMPGMISKSHLNRRLHAIEPTLWQGLFWLLAEAFKKRHGAKQTYVVDSLPVPACDNILRSAAADFIPQESTEGHFAATSPANGAISTACGCIWWPRGRGSRLSSPWWQARRPTWQCSRTWVGFARRLDHLGRQSLHRLRRDYEDLLEEVGLHLKAQRKKNSKRPMATWEEFLGKKPIRQYVETVFSKLTNLFAKKIHAVRPRGFELKVVWFVLAFAIQCL